LRPAQEIWEAALGQLQIQVSRPNYETWLKHTRGIEFQDNTFTIGAPNVFIAEWLKDRLLSLIKKTLAEIIGRNVDAQFIVQAPGQEPPLLGTLQADGGVSTKVREPVKPKLCPKYTFDTFITGESNRLAYAAALEVVENPGNTYNPLFIYGDTGLGKTHLLHAIGQIAKTNGLQALYISAEHFTNEFIIAIRDNNIEGFRHKLRSVNVLLVDDIQFLSGKAQTLECFFHTFNDLYNNNCQIVIASDFAPKAIPSIGKKLRSRLEWGLLVNIQPPNLETRLSILSAKARHLKISNEVLHLLATRFQHNVRELEGALNQVITYSKLSGRNPDLDLTAQALVNIATKGDRQEVIITPKLIIDTVANYYGLTPQALIGKRRDKKTALARQVAMHLMHQENHFRLADIGKALGDRDHTTVLHGCTKIENELNINPQLAASITDIQQAFKSAKASS